MLIRGTITTLLILCAGIPVQAKPRLSDYRLEFNLTRDTIITYEPVALRIAITNVSDHEVSRPQLAVFASTGFMDMPRFVGQHGEIPYLISHTNCGPIDTSTFVGTLQPGERLVHFSQYYGLMWAMKRTGDPTNHISPWTGRTWNLIVRINVAAFDTTGVASVPDSIVLPLRVEAPEGVEAEAVRLYETILAQYDSYDKNTARLTRARFLKQFPHSRILGQVLGYDVAVELDADKLCRLVCNFAMQFPDSPMLIPWASHVRSRGGGEAYQDLLLKIVTYAPSSLLLDAAVPFDTVYREHLEAGKLPAYIEESRKSQEPK